MLLQPAYGFVAFHNPNIANWSLRCRDLSPVWSPEAVEDLVSLCAYITEDSPAAAQRTVRLIIGSIEQLLPGKTLTQAPHLLPAITLMRIVAVAMTAVLLDFLIHHRDIVETGNASRAVTTIKARLSG